MTGIMIFKKIFSFFILLVECYFVFWISKNKDEKEFYLSLENVLSKLDNNKKEIISQVAYALKNNTRSDFKYMKTNDIMKKIEDISRNKQGFYVDELIISGKAKMFLFVNILYNILFLTDYLPISLVFLDFGISISEKDIAWWSLNIIGGGVAAYCIWPGLVKKIKACFLKLINKYI